MYIWKIEPFDIPSTDRTAPPKQIVGIEVGYFAGKVAVLDSDFSPVTLVIDYYDNQGRKREYLQDRIDENVIRSKAGQIGVEGEYIEAFVKQSMDKIVKMFIGGVSIEVKYQALQQLAGMFGQVLIPIENQDGNIETTPNQAPA